MIAGAARNRLAFPLDYDNLDAARRGATAVVESVGVKDILSKSLGSKNPANVVKATLAALKQLRLREQIYESRGLEVRKRQTPPPSTPVVGPTAIPGATGTAGSVPPALSPETPPPSADGNATTA